MCVCVFSVPNEERQSLPGSLSPATRGLNSSTDGRHFLHQLVHARARAPDAVIMLVGARARVRARVRAK